MSEWIFLLLCFWDRICLFCSQGWSGTYYVDQIGLELLLVIFLPQLPECWDYKHKALCLCKKWSYVYLFFCFSVFVSAFCFFAIVSSYMAFFGLALTLKTRFTLSFQLSISVVWCGKYRSVLLTIPGWKELKHITLKGNLHTFKVC